MSELKNVLNHAKNEIRELRRRNEILSAKVETMDNLMALLYSNPPIRTQGMCEEDVTFKIEKFVAEIPEPAK